MELSKDAPAPSRTGSAKKNTQADRIAFVVTLRAEPPGEDRFGRPPVQRLRAALRDLLRRHGLRAVSIREERGG